MVKGKGKRKDQHKRYVKMKKEVKRQVMEYELIDGNFSHYPVAYCKRKGAFLTKGLANTHRCECRHCEMFEKWI